MNPILIFTLSGPVIGGIGWYVDIQWLFWVGVGLCAVNLFMNVTSGVMKAPILPTLIMIVAGVFLEPWYFGAGIGLLAWTALEVVGEFVGLKAEGRL